MKKLISVLAVLCLLCTAAAALAEAEVLTIDKMPKVVSAEEDLELKDADFEGDWIVDKVFLNSTCLTPEQIEENGLSIRPMRIADGKVIIIFTDEEGEHETSKEYTLESNQLLFTDDEGVEAVVEKLEDGNIMMTIFVEGENNATDSISFFMIHPEK